MVQNAYKAIERRERESLYLILVTVFTLHKYITIIE